MAPILLLGSLAAMPPSPVSASTPPTTPQLITPAPGGAMNGSVGQLFTVQSGDPDGHAYVATIEVTVTSPPALRTFDTTLANNGQRSTGTPLGFPIPPGTHTWRARAVDLNGDASGWSASQSFTVTPPPNTGVGQMSGEVTYRGAGQPGLLQECAATEFDLSPTLVADPTVENLSNGIIVNIAGSDYIGPFVFSGGGTGDCANASAGSGTLHADVTGEGPLGADLSCSVTGRFARVLSVVDATMVGTCTINGFNVDDVVFRVQALFRPDPGQGLTQPVMHAVFAGYFTVSAG